MIAVTALPILFAVLGSPIKSEKEQNERWATQIFDDTRKQVQNSTESKESKEKESKQEQKFDLALLGDRIHEFDQVRWQSVTAPIIVFIKTASGPRTDALNGRIDQIISKGTVVLSGRAFKFVWNRSASKCSCVHVRRIS